jgi:signal transduction histidine kinase
MARRILLAVLALIVVLVGLLAVPLGLISAGQYRHDFQDDTVSEARTLANVAEELLGDGIHNAALDHAITGLARDGYRAAVYTRSGGLVAASARRPAVPAGQRIGRNLGSEQVINPDSAGQLLVLVPVLPDSGPGNLGVVALSRSTAPLTHRIAVMWGLVAAVSLAGVATAAVIAAGLARWVSRPLSALEDVAGRLGNGELDARSPDESGPQEVRRLAANFNTMAARLQALVRGHQTMMADVSHQLRTPLAALRLRLELLAQDTDQATADELAGAQEEIARLSRMVSGLLAVARAENVTLAPVQVAVDALISDRVAAWRPAAGEQDVTLATGPVEQVDAWAGDGHLEQILDNLLANAIDAAHDGGTVRVSASASEGKAILVVSDNGPGMSKQQQSGAFRRFGTTGSRGTGLGLAIVDRLVTSNGGTAALSDTPGGGLTVTIELPRAARDRGSRRSTGRSRV